MTLTMGGLVYTYIHDMISDEAEAFVPEILCCLVYLNYVSWAVEGGMYEREHENTRIACKVDMIFQYL